MSWVQLRLPSLAALLMAALWAGETTAQPLGSPVKAQNGMVVSAHAAASEAGIAILKRGGNAVDAAVATGFALAVVYPVAGNLGGGGFMVIRLADGRETALDFREVAPAASSRDMFLDDEGNYIPERSRRGYLASGVPGSVAGLLKAQEAFGNLSRVDVMRPAIQLAKEGFNLTERQANRLNSFRDDFSRYASTAKYFIKSQTNSRYEAGERFVQKDLANTLRAISRLGSDGFYKGKVANLIVAEMNRGGGIISEDDLAEYEAVFREPVAGSYRGYRVLSMPPPSSGGVALLQLLNAVEPYSISEMGYGSSQTIHLMGEAMRRVYADRAKWLGDTDFYPVPVDGLIEKRYMRSRMSDFKPNLAGNSSDVEHGDPFTGESTETTHYSVVDSEGSAVAVTTTINGAYGSLVVVDGAGFFLNNEMDDFSAKPGEPNMFGLVGSEANAIEPGKRMLSSMTPTILEDPQGRLFMVIGTPGGSTIITTVFQNIINVIDHGMNIQEAVAAPRIHHQWLPDKLFFEPLALPKDVYKGLEARGWNLEMRNGYSGRADGVMIGYGAASMSTDPSGLSTTSTSDTGRVFYGGADPRGEDIAIGF